MRTHKQITAKLIINNDSEEQELLFAFKEFGIFRLWQATNKPAYCIISNGFCKLGVLKSEYDRWEVEELSVKQLVDLMIEIGALNEIA